MILLQDKFAVVIIVVVVFVLQLSDESPETDFVNPGG
jgi:hypothetical protein